MSEPAWHDMPPGPGLYTELCSDGHYRNRMVTETSIWGRGRYYGPRDSELPTPPPRLLTSEARRIVDAIIHDLSDRSGLAGAWCSIDGDIQDEIRDQWTHLVITRADK